MNQASEIKELIINNVLYAYYETDKNILFLNVQKEIIAGLKKPSENFLIRLIQYIEGKEFTNIAYLNMDAVKKEKKPNRGLFEGYDN